MMLESLFSDLGSWLTLRVALGLAAILLTLVIMKRKESKHYNLPPGPRPWPILGNLLAFAKDKKTYRLLNNMCKEYGNVMTVYLGSKRTIIINDIQHTREALLNHSDDFSGRPQLASMDFFFERFGDTKDIAMSQPDPKWKLMRKLAHTAIRKYASGEILEDFVNDTMDKVLTLMSKEQTDFDPRKYSAMTVFNTILGALFGKSFELDDPDFLTLKDMTIKFLEAFGNGPVSEFIPMLEYIPYMNTKYLMTETMDIANPFLDLILTAVKEHKEKFQSDSIKDLTDLLLKVQHDAEGEEDAELLKSITSDNHLGLIIMDVFSAASDTTVNSLLWTIGLLAQNQEAQKKLQEEIDQVIGSRNPTLSDKAKMPYYEATSREILRLGVVLPLGLPSATLRDTKLGDYDIPKDTMFMVNFWAIHYNPEFWPEPEKFRPERFLAEDGTITSERLSYMPFGAGRRVCLGESLARSYMFLIITRLFQKFTFSPPPGVELTLESVDNGIMHIPKGYSIRISPRHQD